MHFDVANSVTRADALRLMLEHWRFAPETEAIPLSLALGRVTARDIYSNNTLPACRTSPLDGIAVRLKDFKAGVPDPSGWIKGTDYAPADTGDDFPDEFDAVIAVENLVFEEGKLTGFADSLDLISGEAFNQAGSILSADSLIIPEGTKLAPTQLALLAMGGIIHVPIKRKPKVAFIPTGSELVNAGIKPLRGQNIDANSVMIEGCLKEWGAEPVCFPIVRDDKRALEKALNEALRIADIVLVNGGTSKGEEDFNAALIKNRASFFRHGVRAVPGRPAAVSIIDEKPVINMPGPAIAAWLVADWCVSSLIHHYYGIPAPKRPTMKARLAAPLKAPGKFEALLRVALVKADDGYLVEQIPRKGGTVKSMNCEALLIVPMGITGYAEGDEVTVELLKGPEYY